MWKRIAAILLVVLSLSLAGCASVASGLKPYVDSIDGYEFLYPIGWLEVKVPDGPDVVLHDLIEASENVSVVVSSIAQGKTLAELGTPTDVGYKLGKSAIAPPDSGREAELVSAGKVDRNGNTYYLLEYAVKLPDGQQRHNLASVAISRGKLFTFNASTPEKRWSKVQRMLETAVKSFNVY